MIYRIAFLQMFTQNSTTPHNRDTNKKLVKILHSLLEMDETAPFRRPVPHKALGLGDYKKIVKKPIDLNQIRRQNNQSKYKTIEEALDDIQLCWENCKLYNHATSEVYQQALRLQKIFWKMVQENFADIYSTVEQKIKQLQLNQPNPSIQVASIKQVENLYEASQSQIVPNKQEKQIVAEQSSSNKNVEVQPQESRNSKMEDENNDSNEQNNDNRSQKSSLKEQVKQPIEVCLREKMSAQNLAKLSHHMKSIQQRSVLEQVLQILFTHQKQNMVASPKGEMHFKMQNIHLSTFYRICKVVKLEMDEMLQIIE